MSEYEEQTDYNKVICPYCGYSYQCEGEDYCEDGRDEECGECGKSFHMSTYFSVSHTTSPDCELNGAKHKWEPIKLRNGRTHDFCSICNMCRPYDT